MNADDLRSRQDLEIAKQLMQVKEVKRINEIIEKREEKARWARGADCLQPRSD